MSASLTRTAWYPSTTVQEIEKLQDEMKQLEEYTYTIEHF